MAEFKCNKCGARIELDTQMKSVACTYCGTRLYIDRSGALFCYILPFQTIVDTMEKANDLFRRWCAGPLLAKGAETGAQISLMKRAYFPVYMFKRNIQSREAVFVEPAKSTLLPGMHMLKVPAGDIKIYDNSISTGDAEVIAPDIKMDSYLPQLAGQPIEQSLVYFPIWEIRYVFEGKNYSVVIDGSSGEVFVSEFPHRVQTAYVTIAVAGFIAFFAEGAISGISGTIPLWATIAAMIGTFIGVAAGAFYVAKNK
jgi:hypothetical protein